MSHDVFIMDPSKGGTILNQPHPDILKKLQIFIGLVGPYDKFICDYAKIDVLVTNQLKANSCNIFWGEEQQLNFDKLKVAIATAPLVAIFDPHKPFVVETNASSTAIGAILLQDGWPITSEGKKINRVQQIYSTYESELSIMYML